MGPCTFGDGDMRLTEKRWQAPLARMAPRLPLFQDTAADAVWNDGFGGGHDDLFVYDAQGRLFSWLGSEMTLNAVGKDYLFEQDLITTDGYASVRAITLLASQSRSSRCDVAAAGSGPGAALWMFAGACGCLALLGLCFVARRAYQLRGFKTRRESDLSHSWMPTL